MTRQAETSMVLVVNQAKHQLTLSRKIHSSVMIDVCRTCGMNVSTTTLMAKTSPRKVRSASGFCTLTTTRWPLERSLDTHS